MMEIDKEGIFKFYYLRNQNEIAFILMMISVLREKGNVNFFNYHEIFYGMQTSDFLKPA